MPVRTSSQSKAFEFRRKRRNIVGVTAGVLGAASWIFVLSSLSWNPVVTISKIEVHGVDQELIPGMTVAAWNALDGDYLGLFARANALIYPHDNIVSALASSTPRALKVAVDRRGMNGLSISVIERSPDAVVCADLPDLTDTGLGQGMNCYFSDDRGYIYKPLRGDVPQSMRRYFIPDLGGEKDLSGRLATSTARYRMFQALMNSFEKSGIRTHGMLIRGGHDFEVYADNPDGKSIVVIGMDDRTPIGDQRDNLVAFWNKASADARAKREPLPSWTQIKVQYPPNVYFR